MNAYIYILSFIDGALINIARLQREDMVKRETVCFNTYSYVAMMLNFIQ